ncbi:MAG: ECF transporter S component [archaeon]
MHKYKILVGSAMLAIVSVLLQVYKIAYPWGGVIDIDAVGVPWLISTFLFGIYGGVITSIVSTVGIAVFAPTGIIGASMKFAATIIMVLIVGVAGKTLGFGKKGIAVAFIACLVARPVLMVLFNYFVGIPLFFSIPTEVALQKFPIELFLVPNMILAAIDFWVAYALVFGTKLRERVK